MLAMAPEVAASIPAQFHLTANSHGFALAANCEGVQVLNGVCVGGCVRGMCAFACGWVCGFVSACVSLSVRAYW